MAVPTIDRRLTAPRVLPPAAETRVQGWGRCRGASVRLLEPDRTALLSEALDACRASARGAIPRGMGRSYGDAAQVDGGLVLQLTRLRSFELNRDRGVLTAEAGITVGELLGELVPAGWMLPVVPGTQHVSLGGAIASDIHGKNHGVAGTLGSHVERLGLLTSSGETLELGPTDGLFQATVGGMGLTGVIVWAQVRLHRISSPRMLVDTERVNDLDHALAALRVPGGSYRVAWLDLLSPRWGRGVVTRAEHLPGNGEKTTGGGFTSRGSGATVKARLTVPSGWPGWPLRPATVRAFNELRFRAYPRRERDRPYDIGSHLFPLDVLDAWPRLYGSGGMIQYQLVVPFGAEDVLRRVIEELRQAGLPCYLAVLKDFGPAATAPLSFPIPGWTLTMDIPFKAPGLQMTLDRFDELVAACGGRVYLSKDVRMRADALGAMYPRLDEWRELRERADPHHVWRSDMALRTGLVAREAA